MKTTMRWSLVLTYCVVWTALALPAQALEVSVSEVSFLPTEGEPISLHFAGPAEVPLPLPVPHWTASGRDVPAVFSRGSALRVEALFSVKDGAARQVVISGRCGLFELPAQQLVLGDETQSTASFLAEGTLPNAIGEFPATIEWFLHGETGLEPIGSSSHTLLVTWKQPVNSGNIFKSLVQWSCQFAAGLDDEKAICDALISRLHETGLHYGRRAWSTFQILKKRGGMCGGWCRFFQDFCATQGIEVSAHFFTLEKIQAPESQAKWNAIDIHAPGLNNDEPTFSATAFLVDEVYPMPRYFGISNEADDVEWFDQCQMYRFVTVYDGHCVNFLEYGGKHYMYDPSFGSGPFAGFFGAEIPEDQPMDDASLQTFRAVYFDAAVDHLYGRVSHLADEAGTVKQANLDILTTLVPGNEVRVVWADMDRGGEEPQAPLPQEERFDELYDLPSAETPSYPIDYAASFQAIEEAGLEEGARLPLSELLLRREPLTLRAGSSLPGVLPPLSMLQAAAVRWAKRTGNSSLDKEIRLLRSDTPQSIFSSMIR